MRKAANPSQSHVLMAMAFAFSMEDRPEFHAPPVLFSLIPFHAPHSLTLLLGSLIFVNLNPDRLFFTLGSKSLDLFDLGLLDLQVLVQNSTTQLGLSCNWDQLISKL